MVSASPDPEGAGGTGSTSGASADLGYTEKMMEEWRETYDTSDARSWIKPHRSVPTVVHEPNFVGRQVAWSPNGEWCVVVGNNNRVIVYQRWAKP